jgi:hypothetical protein
MRCSWVGWVFRRLSSVSWVVRVFVNISPRWFKRRVEDASEHGFLGNLAVTSVESSYPGTSPSSNVTEGLHYGLEGKSC